MVVQVVHLPFAISDVGMATVHGVVLAACVISTRAAAAVVTTADVIAQR
jgi:hypothetical protein